MSKWITIQWPLTSEQYSFFGDEYSYVMDDVWTHCDDIYARDMCQTEEYKVLFGDMPFSEVFERYWAMRDMNNQRWPDPIPKIYWSEWAKTKTVVTLPIVSEEEAAEMLKPKLVDIRDVNDLWTTNNSFAEDWNDPSMNGYDEQ